MWNLNDVKEMEYKTDDSWSEERKAKIKALRTSDFALHTLSCRIMFDDGASAGAGADFPEYLHRDPVFAPLRDAEIFRTARIKGGAIAWPDGADTAPETFHEKCEQAHAPGA